jgi:pyridoxamine 5'-phosphate oxidase
MSKVSEHISKLREDFLKGALAENDVNKNPFLQFEAWLSQAIEAEVPEVQACTLGTVLDNKPSSRIVYLREFNNNQFWFYGNYDSKKGKSLLKNKNACLNFFWPALERQIRIEGTVELAAKEMSDAYFNARPRESKLGAWASAQSSRLSSRTELENKLEEIRKKFEGKEVPRPDNWGGWILAANYYEFWQGRKSRLHDRIAYGKKENGWEISRLAP